MGWTQEERKIAFKLVDEDKLYREIAEALAEKGYNRTPEAIRSFLKRHKKDFDAKNKRYQGAKQARLIGGDAPEAKARRPAMDNQMPDAFRETIQQIETLRDHLMDTNHKKFARIGRPGLNADYKVLALSDLHVPFDNSEVIEHALTKHAKDTDVLVINGDLFELYSVSKWPKHKDIMLRWEYHLAIEWMRLFSETFREVYLVSGNHEHRLKTYFSANVDPMVSFLVSDDMLSKVAKGYDFDGDSLVPMYDFKNVHYQPGMLSWYAKIGKCIFAHPRTFSSVPVRTAIKTADYFMDKEDFQAVVIGHTHKISKLVWRDKLIMEQGCCCVPMDYEADGKLKYLPQAFGYAVVYMDRDGNVDFDKSNPVYVGTGYTLKSNV
jgi:predicted phosphodiesterase